MIANFMGAEDTWGYIHTAHERTSKPSIRVRFPAGPPLMLRSYLRLCGCWISAITEHPWPSP